MDDPNECYQGTTAVEGITAKGVEEETVPLSDYCCVGVCGYNAVCSACSLWWELHLSTLLGRKLLIIALLLPIASPSIHPVCWLEA